jgi:hypothetical protein
VETENGGSRRDRSRHERSPREESHRERREERSRQERWEGEGSHQSRRHRDKSHHDESQHSIHDAKMKDLKDKYSRILRRINGEDQKLMAWDMLKDENLPFTKRVKKFPMPNKFKMPRIEKYDESGDPQAHLEAFREHIILHGTPNEIACKAFPLTLRGVAKDWFTELPPKSVGTFKELGHLFLTQFLAIRKRKKSTTCLLTLCQGKKKTLKDFMLRFNKEKLEVDSPDDKTMLNALM